MSSDEKPTNVASDRSDTEDEQPQLQEEAVPAQPKKVARRKNPRPQQQQQQQQYQPPQQQQLMQPQQNQVAPPPPQQTAQQALMRPGAVRESRIKDRPQPKEVRDSSLKIKIELDLEVEVDLYARVKGDVTIGLL